MAKKSLCLGFDLDGVIVDKLVLIPKILIEWSVKSCCGTDFYRFPKSQIEQRIRKISHFYLFRRSLRKNIEFIRKLKKQGYKLYVISGRYSFLEEETMDWLKKKGLENLFEKVFINRENEQPHLFKEKIIKKLDLDYYFEDDVKTFKYLKERLAKTKVFLINENQKLSDAMRQ